MYQISHDTFFKKIIALNPKNYTRNSIPLNGNIQGPTQSCKTPTDEYVSL